MKALDKRQVRVLFSNHLQAESLSGWLDEDSAGDADDDDGEEGRGESWERGVWYCSLFSTSASSPPRSLVIITIITCDGGSEENPEDDEYPSVGAKAVLAVCFEPNRTEKIGMEVGWHKKFKSSEWNPT